MDHDYEKIGKQYAEEVQKRWGDTDAYRESTRRTARYTADDWREVYGGMDAVMEGFARLNERGVSPDHEKPRLQVRKLQEFISARFYPCTDEILAGLGEMYVGDERFRESIDRHGEGTAAYIAACIKSYCR